MTSPSTWRSFAANRTQLRLLIAAFRGGVLALVFEVSAWVVTMIDKA